MAKQQVKIKSGQIEFGRLYEQRIAALLAIKSALDTNISDFWMVSNIDGVKAFDDIVFMVQNQTTDRKLYCIQLKHLENKSLQATLLESDNKNFSLKKYEESFKVVKDGIETGKNHMLKDFTLDQVVFILWTNAPLSGQNNLKQLKINNVSYTNLLATSRKTNVYRLSNLAFSETPFDETFLQQFYIFANQASATSLDMIIKDEIISHFEFISNSVIINITDYFTKWSLGHNKVIKQINKKDIQMKLLEFIVLPWIVEPEPVKEPNDLEKFELMRKTLQSFNIVQIRSKKLLSKLFNCNKFILEKLCQLELEYHVSWNVNLTQSHWNSLEIVNGEEKERFRAVLRDRSISVPCLTIKDAYLAAWECNLIPLIFECNSSQNMLESVLTKFENVTKNLTCVILRTADITVEGNLKVFRNLNNLEDIDLKERNLQEMFVSLQGKEKINLSTYKDKIDVLVEINPDVYLILMSQIMNLGQTIETESYYVKRDVRRPLLKPSVLGDNKLHKNREFMLNTEGDVIILVEYSHPIPVRYQYNHMELMTYVRHMKNEEYEDKYILVTDCSDQDEVVQLAADYLYKATKKSVHVLKLKPNFLEWSFSKGTVETLQKHLLTSNLLKEENPEYNIHEDKILESSRSNVNIISNNAGMGKTFMLSSIANKFRPNEWVLYINLSEHISKIPQEQKLEYFFKYIYETNMIVDDELLTHFCRKIFLDNLGEKAIVFLFDGYDEVASNESLQFLKEAKESGLKMWITTRPTYTSELEIQMENLAIQITHFSTEDHITFLWKYFRSYNHLYTYNDSQIQYIIDTINECSSNLDRTMIAQPLQTRMFAEIFGRDITQIDKKRKMDIVDLYNEFVDVKLQEYKSYEVNSLKKTFSKLALKLFFTESVLDDLLDFEELAEESSTFKESYKKDSLVIGLNKKGDAVFGHRTFAEFLAAHWLAKYIINRKGGFNVQWLPILQKLYYIEMTPVRVFFDRILSRTLPLHMAILNDDIHNVKNLSKEHKESRDILGRSALHIAVTYGTYYDLYTSREVKGLRNVGLHSVIRIADNNCRLKVPKLEELQYSISLEIIEELLNQGFLNTTDKLFGYDLFDYAMKACCLNFVNILYKRFEKNALHFEIGYSFEILLYCIISDNLYNIFSKRKMYNFDVIRNDRAILRNMFSGYNFKLLQMKYNDMYTTELAALRGATEIFFDLMDCGAMKLEDGNVLHKACFNGNIKILELMRKFGANFNKLDNSDWFPLYQAGVRGRQDLVYDILKNFKKSNTKSGTGMTPLHFAVQGGHLDCVKKLLEYDVNVNVADTYGNTPLVYGCKYGHIDIMEVLLTSGHLHISDSAVQSIINLAAFHGYHECITMLLKYNLNVNNIDKDGNTPLVVASKKGFASTIKALAGSKDCKLDLMVYNESRRSLVMWCSGNGHIILQTKLIEIIRGDWNKVGGVTALHFAARHKHIDCAKTLVELGADTHIQDEIIKCSPLEWASMYGSENVIKVLLNNCNGVESKIKTKKEAELGVLWAVLLGYENCFEILQDYLETCGVEDDSDVEHQQRLKSLISGEFINEMWFIGEDENIPLLIAAKNGYLNLIKSLTSRKYKNNEGLQEALFWASRNGHLEIVKELLQTGADDTKKNKKHLRLLPISWASMYGRTKVVEYFLKNRTANYDLENKDFQNALCWAAVGGHYECLKLLIDFGLDVDFYYEDLYGTSIVCACEHRGTVEVVKELIERKCKVNVKNIDGKTPLDFAARRSEFEIVKLLIDTGAFNDMNIQKDSDLFKNLQCAFKWALENKEEKLIAGLTSLGISID